jgi:hypothetical protein
MSVVNKILESEYEYYTHKTYEKDYSKQHVKHRKTHKKRITPKPRIPYNEYILGKIKTFKDLKESLEKKEIFLISFVYNSGVRNIKSYNNRCEFKIRVNKGDIPVTKVFLLNSLEIEQTLTLLKKLKGAM